MNPTQQVDMPTPEVSANHWYGVGLFFALFIFLTSSSSITYAASCCGGGASSGIILPKFNNQMWDVSVSHERYDGAWTKEGVYQDDPADSDLLQRRLDFSYAYRLADQWQINVGLPLVDNQNKYSGDNSSVQGLGDMQLSIWYEAFNKVTCVYKINGWESLKPSIYFGTSLTIPTGISPYSDRVDSSSDITGLGFYRLDANMIIEKTVYPYSISWQGKYGYTFERPVNQEYEKPVKPYNKKLGDRTASIFSAAYTWFLPNLSMLSLTASHSTLKEQSAQYDGITDTSSGLEKTTLGLSLAYSSAVRDWIFKLGVNQAQDGENIPKTQIINMGISHVY
ncbi:hypothetical protein ACU6U9_10715 [Pseudomonas sp. HK3]